jgi:uncharacterized protein (DUF1800 family)
MRIQFLGSAAALTAAAAVAVSTGVSTSEGGSGFTAALSNPITAIVETGIQPEEAARLAKQTSFGPTPELINAIVAKKSASAWLEEQFSLSSSTYSDLRRPVPLTYCSAFTGTAYSDCRGTHFSMAPIQSRFYSNAINKDDQLRQRTAFALSQIIAVSDYDSYHTAGFATFNEILLSNAFGNYRDILKAVTLNGHMGDYLDMADSNWVQPNENYARELMQLFSIGTVLLNPDGTPQTDSAGATIAAYSNNDVKEIARALTGWTFDRLNGASVTDNTNRDLTKPMIQVLSRFDAKEKTFLGKTVPSGATQQANVDAVVDAVFNHPNTGPFICKRLIQQLTIANPTPAYVERVAAVFADNGEGVRGDLKAIVRAIYLDSEARVVSQLPGKVKEPVLLATSLARAVGYTTDGYAFTLRDAGMGQSPFRPPSVAGFYPFNFPLPQGSGIVSPTSKLMNTSTIMGRHNFIFDWTIGSDSRPEFQPTITALGTVPNWAPWESNGTNDGKTIDRINLVMLNGTMTPAQRQALVSAMAAIKNSDPALQTRRRAQAAMYIVASSPFFQVDR